MPHRKQNLSLHMFDNRDLFYWWNSEKPQHVSMELIHLSNKPQTWIYITLILPFVETSQNQDPDIDEINSYPQITLHALFLPVLEKSQSIYTNKVLQYVGQY